MASALDCKGKVSSFATLNDYGSVSLSNEFSSADQFVFMDHCTMDHFTEEYERFPDLVLVDIPLLDLLPLVRKSAMVLIASKHDIPCKGATMNELKAHFIEHNCDEDCQGFISVFRHIDQDSSSASGTDSRAKPFPPKLMSPELQHDIFSDIASAFDPSAFEEAGCMVCGKLTLVKDLVDANPQQMNFHLLERPIVTRLPRKSSSGDIPRVEGPILASGCDRVCIYCAKLLRRQKIPKNALCNGLWIGDVPPELSDLSYAEQMMISKIRHNRCVVRVDSGRGKLVGNAVMYATPVLKVYDKLPPKKDELSEVLAFVFLGHQAPTKDELKRTPMIVRKNQVVEALEWLKLNHPSYRELEISQENLDTYELLDVPVTVDWKKTGDGEDSTNPLTVSTHGQEQDGEGTTEGPCTFRVDGLTGKEYGGMTELQMKMKALSHMHSGGMALGIGHAAEPESIYDNPMAYPAMFPWLFPFGLGGLRNPYLPDRFSEIEHKRHMLMYYDKRFQTDLYFPLLAFNHDQIKGGVTGSFLMTNRTTFDAITNRLLSIDRVVLADVTRRVLSGEKLNMFTAKTDEEKKCFKVLDDLDHVGGHVKGSITSKKYMKNEIWALTSHLGAPTWYITLSPADNRHPLCLYYAGEQIEFNPELRSSNERNYLVAKNPVAAARFFDYMIKTFIRCVLGVGTKRDGIFGKTSGYYGTVEQQGRLTLHWHALIWVDGAPSPEVIRDLIKGPVGSEFSQKLIAYLESCHEGGLSTGDLASVQLKIPKTSSSKGGLHDIVSYDDADYDESNASGYKDPTQTMPDPPPEKCHHEDPIPDCPECAMYAAWLKSFIQTVDDLRIRSNIHSHHTGSTTKGKKSQGVEVKAARTGCINEQGVCSARFPRELIPNSEVDFDDGFIKMKQTEAMMNCTNAIATWFSRSNTDISSLLSGTALQAVIAYITNYITKPSLKSYQAIEIMNRILQSKLEQVLGGDSETRKENARRIIVIIVNALTAKLEIGSPMASMYGLGNPDHYTSHYFTTFWWKPFVETVKVDWNLDADIEGGGERVIISRDGDDYISYSRSDDYRFRPRAFSDVPLVEWFRCSRKIREDKRKLSRDMEGREEVRAGWWRLHRDHPQYNTHIVQYNPRAHENRVLNYVGGLLPRKDIGDREFYCMTMLCLFKPWRNGRDLKRAEQTWDDAFVEYNFLPWMVDRMKNFNLRYECYDARHDFYHIQLKKTKAAERLQKGFAPEDDGEEETEDYVAAPPEDYIDEGDDNGARTSRREINMDLAEKILREAGWMEPCSENLTGGKIFQPDVQKSPAQWKETVAKERKRVMNRRLNHKQPEEGNDGQRSSRKTAAAKSNVVKVVDPMKYMPKKYQERADVSGKSKTSVVADLTLNDEQERAFRIVANHASTPQEIPLRMYLGGMAGTGKSQVIKALVKFFEGRDEPYRFILLAPTGTAAALINGSTYHSVFCIRGGEWVGGGSETSNVRKLRTNLEGVEYIFIDEVSMVSAQSFYQISAKLAKALGNPDEPFGGINMIFAGDFVQLPPVKLNPVWKRTKYKNRSRPDKAEQEQDIGRAVWRQVTTVVILRRNMRQTEAGSEDDKFRKALRNIRTCNCDEDDIAFLRSRVVGFTPDRPKLTDSNFRNVAVITAQNATKDRMNELGTHRFALDTQQELYHFYSRDTLANNMPVFAHKKKKVLTSLGPKTQEALWKASPCSSDHFAGKLSLCPGMPIILRNNDATELCITRGQDATVHGWEYTEKDGRKYLDVLYVKLTNPPSTVNIPGLPTNVVPIMRRKRTLKCELPNDKIIQIERDQVDVLPLFAMTVHSSQGKNRPYNVVHLNNCPDHLYYYTALSRGTSAAGTCIIQGFDSTKITGGDMSGLLRQELRDLETLDEITKLRYEGKLDTKAVRGEHRYTLITSYKQWKAGGSCSSQVEEHGWDQKETQDWTLHEKDKLQYASLWKGEKEQACGSRKRKRGQGEDVDPAPHKKSKRRPKGMEGIEIYSGSDLSSGSNPRPAEGVGQALQSKQKKRKATKSATQPRIGDQFVNRDSRSSQVRGLKWDNVDFSCAYDSVLTILWNIWLEDPDRRSQAWSAGSVFLASILDGFRGTVAGQYSLVLTRDYVRQLLHQWRPTSFPMGRQHISVVALQEVLFTDFPTGSTYDYCMGCQYYLRAESGVSFFTGWSISGSVSTAAWLRDFSRKQRSAPCIRCNAVGNVWRSRNIEYCPDLLSFSVDGGSVSLSHSVEVLTSSGIKGFRLSGVVYHVANHFTCRYIDGRGNIWYHDGITTGDNIQWDGTLTEGVDMGIRPSGAGVAVATHAFYVC